MSKRQYVVRVVQTYRSIDASDRPSDYEANEGDILAESFLECLRYAELITVHSVDPNGLTARCFDIHAPHAVRVPEGIGSAIWAENTAAWMRGFGYNAVKAPSTIVTVEQAKKLLKWETEEA